MKVFFDTEFTGLQQNTTLISIGCVAENGKAFYAECMDYDRTQVNDWLRENVIKHLRWDNGVRGPVLLGPDNYEIYTDRARVGELLSMWLGMEIGEPVEMWGDCLAYDWMLFCELFGGALNIPKCVYYIPFDLATLLKAKGHDPDMEREPFGPLDGSTQHNALHDAKCIKACYEWAMSERQSPGAE